MNQKKVRKVKKIKSSLKFITGFSLVELSIVIIIIGLLVTSVLVGKDLIKSAEIRGLVTQLDSMDAAVSTFRLKYNGFPGDLRKASKRGLGTHDGDGDSAIEDDTTGGDPDTANFEIIYFWEHLTLAGYINGRFDGDNTNGIIGETFPEAKAGGGIVVYTYDGTNYYHVGIADATAGTPKVLAFQNVFIPEDAFVVDNKIDDGFPLKGKVIARSASCAANPTRFSCANTPITTSSGASQTAGEACVKQDGATQDVTLDEYDFDTTSEQCNLRIEMQN